VCVCEREKERGLSFFALNAHITHFGNLLSITHTHARTRTHTHAHALSLSECERASTNYEDGKVVIMSGYRDENVF